MGILLWVKKSVAVTLATASDITSKLGQHCPSPQMTWIPPVTNPSILQSITNPTATQLRVRHCNPPFHQFADACCSRVGYGQYLTPSTSCWPKWTIRLRLQADQVEKSDNNCTNSDCNDLKQPGELLKRSGLGCWSKVCTHHVGQVLVKIGKGAWNSYIGLH